MKVFIAKNDQEAARMGADIIEAVVRENPKCTLGLATGSSPVGMYQELARRCREEGLDFSQIHSVNLDEYVGLDGTHDQSYRYFMNTNLFDRVNIDIHNTNVPNGMAADLEGECDSYDNLIHMLGGIDMQLLGLGHNGHIGFNEPGESFEKGTHIVSLSQSTIDANSRLFESKEDVPKKAITMGIRTIMQAGIVLLIASGKDKADIVRDAFWGKITPEVPASVLQLHKNLIIVADEDALSKSPVTDNYTVLR